MIPHGGELQAGVARLAQAIRRFERALENFKREWDWFCRLTLWGLVAVMLLIWLLW